MPPPEPVVRVHPDFAREFPDGSPLATECFLNFGLVAGGAQSALQRLLADHGVSSLAAFNVLTIVHGERQPLSPSVIAGRMLVSRPTVTGVLDSLEARRLISRRAHSGDARMRRVALTRVGRSLVETLLPIVHRFEKDVLACLTEAQQRTLLRTLALLERHIPTVMPGAALKVVD